MKIFKIAYHLLIYFVLTTSAYAANHYIRAGASGANNGSDWTNAWTTLPDTLVRGDTYYIADGTYGTYTFDDADSGSTWIYIKKATVSAHGTDTGWSDSYGDGVALFTGKWIIATNYLDIDGVTGGGPGAWETGHGFKVAVSTTSGSEAARNIHFYGPAGTGNYINLKHIEATKTDGPNFSSWDCPIIENWTPSTSTYVNISYCWLHTTPRGAIVGWAFNNHRLSHWTIEYSKLGDNYGNDSAHGEILAPSGWTNFTLRYNYFYKWRSTGCIYVTGSANDTTDWDIYGNIFDGTNSTAWWVIGGGASTDAQFPKRWKIYNNTFINYLDESAIGALRYGGTGNEMKNNIFWYTGAGPREIRMAIDEDGTYPGSQRSVENDYNWYTGDTYNNSYGESNGINGGSANPFVNSSSDFHLTSAIPGVTLGPPYDKTMEGVTRGIDGVYDRGAFEYNRGESSVPLPPENLRIN